ncbi:PREDICTED: vomeronasal type-1 receptor 4-like [Chrysochloris asiatica]|uniref:Vomeronasal type-1 receptor n=1 Tax=Chrysochloris asiatica TaxID=185453 RepID=A0A9B0TQW1_CHRAS|nr:PREDICTED: vomeronasal type-1 receptor 4-like [Chrysochloris asiatica]
MASRSLTMGIIFLSQTLLGILGNCSLLFHYVFTKCRLRSTHLILKHLTVANCLVLLSKGIPQTMAAFGWKDFLNDFECKLVFYVHRMSRGLSISTACLLSIFQVIIISSGNSRWAELKVKGPKYVAFSIFLCWILHMLINVIIPIYVTIKGSNKTIAKIKDLVICSTQAYHKTTTSLFAALITFPDAVCLGLMICTSGSIIFILYRHQQRVQHIHSNHISPRFSPEIRATQTILVFLSTFVSFYSLSSILQIYMALFRNSNWWLVNMSALSAACFPTVSPYVLMSTEFGVSRFCFASIQNTKLPHLTRNM